MLEKLRIDGEILQARLDTKLKELGVTHLPSSSTMNFVKGELHIMGDTHDSMEISLYEGKELSVDGMLGLHGKLISKDWEPIPTGGNDRVEQRYLYKGTLLGSGRLELELKLGAPHVNTGVDILIRLEYEDVYGQRSNLSHKLTIVGGLDMLGVHYVDVLTNMLQVYQQGIQPLHKVGKGLLKEGIVTNSVENCGGLLYSGSYTEWHIGEQVYPTTHPLYDLPYRIIVGGEHYTIHYNYSTQSLYYTHAMLGINEYPAGEYTYLDYFTLLGEVLKWNNDMLLDIKKRYIGESVYYVIEYGPQREVKDVHVITDYSKLSLIYEHKQATMDTANVLYLLSGIKGLTPTECVIEHQRGNLHELTRY